MLYELLPLTVKLDSQKWISTHFKEWLNEVRFFPPEFKIAETDHPLKLACLFYSITSLTF